MENPGYHDRIAQRLADPQYACANDTDAFSPSAAWRAAVHPVVATIRPFAAAELSTKAFAATHRLSAILALRGGDGEAIVNGQTLRKGQQLDGFLLTSIWARHVRFTGSGGAVDLILAP